MGLTFIEDFLPETPESLFLEDQHRMQFEMIERDLYQKAYGEPVYFFYTRYETRVNRKIVEVSNPN